MSKEKRPLACIILAAGNGSRMHSTLLKPLHRVAGRTMLAHVLAAAEGLRAEKIITVIGPNMDAMAEAAAPHGVAVQQKAMGTGDAVKAGMTALGEFEGDVLVLYGDTPLVTTATLEKMLTRRGDTDDPAIVLSGITKENPTGYGRIMCDAVGRPQRIIEERDADEWQKQIKLCNGGIMLFNGKHLPGLLAQLTTNNAKGEYYLTDTIALARTGGHATAVIEVPVAEVSGVNTRAELAECEIQMQQRLRTAFMLQGVTLQDPATTYFSWDTELGQDVVIGPNVVFGPGVKVANNVEIRSFCHLEGAKISEGAVIGPFARMRPGAVVGEGAVIANFVELKNSNVGKGTKIKHFSYIGDTDIGSKSNIAAGTIACDYDGFKKYRTTIGNGTFIGSATVLVAPVTVADNAMVAAGSVIVKDVPEDALAISRPEQKNKMAQGMASRRRKSMQEA